jgi:TrmH family RNA methyltransferase
MNPVITSRQNALAKRVRRAIDEHAAEIVIEGPKAVADAIAAGWVPIAVVERDGGLKAAAPQDGQSGAQRGAAGFSLPSLFDAKLFDSLAETRTSQGVIGLFERPAPRDVFADEERVVVALDGVQDPGNVGTIVRLAAAFDAGGVVLLPGSADAYSPKAIRASAGAILSVAVVAMTHDELLARGWPLYAADARGEPLDPPSRHAVFVFGSEGSGVSPALAARATPIAVPMSPRVESLNVASSAAILLARSYARR